MGSNKITKKLLKKVGLSHMEKELIVPIDQRIEDGKEKNRQHLQQVKNSIISQEIQKGIRSKENIEYFNFRGESQEYSSLKSLLSERDWNNLELE
jgi:hypothetical protein